MDMTVKMWDSHTGKLLHTYKGHTAPVHHALFAKGGSRIISASRDATVKIWNTDSENIVATLAGHTNTVYNIAIHNNLIISASSDATLKVPPYQDATQEQREAELGY